MQSKKALNTCQLVSISDDTCRNNYYSVMADHVGSPATTVVECLS